MSDPTDESGERPPYPPTLGEALEEIASRLEVEAQSWEENIGVSDTKLQAREAAGRADAFAVAADIVRDYDGDADE